MMTVVFLDDDAAIVLKVSAFWKRNSDLDRHLVNTSSSSAGACTMARGLIGGREI